MDIRKILVILGLVTLIYQRLRGFRPRKRGLRSSVRYIIYLIAGIVLMLRPILEEYQSRPQGPPPTIDMPFDESQRTKPAEVEDPTPPEGKPLFEEDFTPARVVNVVDGDTIDIIDPVGDEYRVRLILVDTPETKHPKKGLEFYGQEASNYTKDVLKDRVVYLEQDVSETDRFGRVLAYIWLEAPRSKFPTDEEIRDLCFNSMLIENGFAQLSTFPPDVKYQDQFQDVQEIARSKNRGMWNQDMEKKWQDQRDRDLYGLFIKSKLIA